MEKIMYACCWEKEKESSWSGTHWNLYKALCNDVQIMNFDYGLHNDSIYSYYRKLSNKIGMITNCSSDRFGYRNIKHYQKVFKKKFSDEIYSAIQFEECPYQHNINSYIYQDMCVAYLKELFVENHELYNVSGAPKCSLTEMEIRWKNQTDFFMYPNTKIFTMGKWLKVWLDDRYSFEEGKVIHVGGGINIDVSKINYSGKQKNKVLFVGKDFERKNGYFVVNSFKKAREIRKDIELYIIGPEKIDVEGEGIYFLGNKKFSELPYYFNMCDIFCMPSKFEAYGLVFPEALSFGLPCIGRNEYEMPYFIEDGKTGIILKQDEEEECAKAILNLLDSSYFSQNVKDRKEVYLEEYSWNSVARRMIENMKIERKQ